MSYHFTLDARLQADSLLVARDSLSQLRLMNDRRFPWLLLIPEVADVSEVFDLTDTQQAHLWHTSSLLSKTVKALLGATKMNTAALGNVVAQLHIHHIARFAQDLAWPAPVWGYVATHGGDHRYNDTDARSLMARLASSPLKTEFDFVPDSIPLEQR